MDERKNVLICEDDPLQLRILTAAFMQAGCRARAAGVTRIFEKPYSILEIVRSVGRAVKERAAGRILVVDDHGPARSAIAGALGDAGFETVAAEDGARALEALAAAKKSVDLVVMDLNVPGPSGAALVRRMRKIDPGVGILMMTGEASHEEIVAAYGAGASSLLRKPFGEDGLVRFVKAHLASARKRRAAAEREAKERAREAAAPWTRRLSRAVRAFWSGRRKRAAGLALAAVAAGVILAAAVGSTGVTREPDEGGRVQRQMLDEMRRFSDGYQKELRWYGIVPR